MDIQLQITNMTCLAAYKIQLNELEVTSKNRLHAEVT